MYSDDGKTYSTGYYLYPRSSLSKTNLRLANSVGIIDAGYRGNVCGIFDCLQSGFLPAHARLVQICAPNLAPILLEIVDSVEKLSAPTERGTGGFGSTNDRL